MSSISNILTFIEKKGYSVAWFEEQAGLGNGSLKKTSLRGKDLTDKTLEKISKKFGQELLAEGYYVIEATPFGKQGLMLIDEAAKNRLSRTDVGEKKVEVVGREPTAMEILDRLSQAFLNQSEAFRTQAELLRSIESKMAQEQTQAIIKEQTAMIQFSLQDVQGKVTTLWERQHLAIEEMRDHFAKLGVQKTPASAGAHKKQGRSDGNN